VCGEDKVKKAPKKFPSKTLLRAVKVFNSWDLGMLSKQRIYISWTPQLSGRGYRPAHYAVIHIGHKTDPKGHWMDDGHKSFHLYGREERDLRAAEAMKWANKKFGKRAWVRDPFGSLQSPETLEAAWKLVNAEKERRPK
jgi:hypothetical protein